MYAQDSFFTLTLLERIGLVSIALALSLACIWFVLRISTGRVWYIRLAVAIAVFCLFELLSPQFFYFYYIGLFENLPLRLVLTWPPSPKALAEILLFQERGNLSFHSRALLGWLLIALALCRPGPNQAASPASR